MISLTNFFTKSTFKDGSSMWPSGREQFTYVDILKRRFVFDVFHSTPYLNATNTIISSSIVALSGETVSSDTKNEVLSKAKDYFLKRKQNFEVI
jgi:hypothetical protein